MKRYVLFFLLLIIQSIPASAQWRSAAPYNGITNDLFFTDRLTGYACGLAAGIGNCSGTTSIIRTVDGGETWIRMNTGSTAAMTRLHFIDAFTGWAVGASSTVIKTTDGGQSWTMPSSGVGAGLNDIHFPTASVGYVVGANGLVRKSTNGGTTWTTQASGFTGTLNSVWFVDANTGFFVGNTGTIKKTINGGTTWSSVYTGTEFFKEVWFADASNGYVISNNKLLKTTNGGSSWTSYDAPVGQNWLRMNFSSLLTGVIITDGNFILKTSDGGITWTALPTNFNEPLSCAYFIDENTGYTGNYSSGRITKTTNGCSSWTNVNSGMGERILGIDFRTPLKGVFVGNSGGIFATTNGALNVRKMHSNFTLSLTAAYWMNDSTVVACGDSGTILRSTNSGWSWMSIPTGVQDALLDMHGVDSVVAYSSGANGMVIKTQDAGLTWSAVPVDTLLPLRGIHFLNRDTGMTVSDYAVFKTVNGGLSWELKNDSIQSTSDFNDVWMTSAYVAYAAGGFGRMYKTVDGGEIWRRVFPSDNTNAEIDEMQFFTDSIGYFARLNSQSFTLNGGTNVGSQSTYCLANNGGVDAIDLPTQEYGYCAGGISSVLHTMKPFTVWRTYLQDSVFCAGSRIFVGYNASGLLYNNNVVNAELSNASGDFSSPTIIGTYTIQLPETDPSGIITCTLPAGLNGDGYRIRVVCVSPVLTGPDNGYNVKIRTSIQPSVLLNSSILAVCGGEPVEFTASGVGLGVNPRFSWLLNTTLLTLESSSIVLDTLSTLATVVVNVTSSLTCANPAVNAASILIDVAEKPPVYAGADTSICAGESVQLGSPSTLSAVWEPVTGLSAADEDAPVATPEMSTTYFLTISSAAGCSSRDTVTVTVNELPSQPVIELAGGNLVVVGNPAGTFTWFVNDEPLEGETNDTLVISSTGNFTVQWTDENGCVSAVSDSIPIGTVGIVENPEPKLTMRVDEWSITGLTKGITRYNVALFDVSGRMILQRIIEQDAQGNLRIAPIALSTGMYFLTISSPDMKKSDVQKSKSMHPSRTFKFVWN